MDELREPAVDVGADGGERDARTGRVRVYVSVRETTQGSQRQRRRGGVKAHLNMCVECFQTPDTFS